MGTAKQLVSAFVEATPLTWDRSYSKNMRPIRGYPDYWRIIDTEAYVDGPPSLGATYNKDLYIWQAKILEDEDGNLTNSFEISNLGDYLTETSEVVNGETVYRYKYNSDVESYTYSHTSVIDSISLDFDQLGRRLIAFESAGDINFVWYDPQAGQTVTTNFGAGYTPYIVTDTYRRTGGSADSERLLFYVDSTTKQIVYRRQDDRYQTAYTLPSAPADVVELLKVSKNLYGGLTVLYCYDDGTGGLTTGSFTARDATDVVNIGTDRQPESQASVTAESGAVIDFVLKPGLKETSPVNTASIAPTSGTLANFVLRENTVYLNSQTSTASASYGTGTLSSFSLKSSTVAADPQKASASISVNSGTLQGFLLKRALIAMDSYGAEDAEMTVVSGQITDFLLG